MTNDARFRKEIFEDKIYDVGIPEDSQDLVVLDVGAHIGQFSEYIYPKAKIIYAVEPYKPLFDRMVLRLIKLHMTDKIKCFNIGIAGTKGRRLLNILGGEGGSSIHYEGTDRIEIDTLSLADFMKQENITHVDVLKIDTEGAEGEIFESSSFKDVAPFIDNIVGEPHSGVDVSHSLLSQGFTYSIGNGVFWSYQLKDSDS